MAKTEDIQYQQVMSNSLKKNKNNAIVDNANIEQTWNTQIPRAPSSIDAPWSIDNRKPYRKYHKTDTDL